MPIELQDRVLSWGIIGAVLMRGVMIGAGVAAVHRFRWMTLLFAAILLVSAVKLLLDDDDADDLAENMVLRISKRLVGATSEYDGARFLATDMAGRRAATPLLLCLVCIELSDFVFAVDSVPAVLGVSTDGLIVYSSNIFAIMGLRSLYTLVAHAVNDLPYLKPAVALVLGFIAVKMALEFFDVRISTQASLAVVVLLLGGGVLLSLVAPGKDARAKKELPAPEVEHPPPHVAAASLHRRKDRQSGACYEVDDATMKV